MKVLGAIVAAVLLAACARSGTATTSAPVVEVPPVSTAVRLLFAGDLMVGRGVAPVLADEGLSLFEDVRFVVSQADLAAANLESVLVADVETVVSEGQSLVGATTAAPVLAGVGFDLLSVANNHAGDSGEDAVAETAGALERSGVDALGVVDAGTLPAPVIRQVSGVRVAYLAFDLTKQGPAPTAGRPGVATWDPDVVVAAVTGARSLADVVAVSLHGGVEYLPGPDPALRAAATLVAAAGADVVWAHGSHVVYEIEVVGDEDRRVSVVAYGLGNFLFDQHRRGTTDGAIVEVLADKGGVVAYRVGTVVHAEVWPRFTGWKQPVGDAVLLDGDWWQLTRQVATTPAQTLEGVAERHGADVEAVGAGDVIGDGRIEVVVAFRRPYEERPVHERFPDAIWTDEQGRTAHLGVYRPEDLGPVWVASGLAHPIVGLAVCDGSLAVAYGPLRSDDAVFSGAWTWRNKTFAVAPDLPGFATPGCADVDGDGSLDPVLLGRVPAGRVVLP